MISIETMSVDAKIDERIEKLLDGPPSNDYNQRQIQLAVEKFCIEHAEKKLDNNTLEEITMTWATSEFSKLFSGVVHHPDFKTNKRLLGNISHVTLTDINFLRETGKLRE